MFLFYISKIFFRASLKNSSCVEFQKTNCFKQIICHIFFSQNWYCFKGPGPDPFWGLGQRTNFRVPIPDTMYLDPQNCVKPGWKISWNVSNKTIPSSTLLILCLFCRRKGSSRCTTTSSTSSQAKNRQPSPRTARRRRRRRKKKSRGKINSQKEMKEIRQA